MVSKRAEVNLITSQQTTLCQCVRLNTRSLGVFGESIFLSRAADSNKCLRSAQAVFFTCSFGYMYSTSRTNAGAPMRREPIVLFKTKMWGWNLKARKQGAMRKGLHVYKAYRCCNTIVQWNIVANPLLTFQQLVPTSQYGIFVSQR